MSSGVIQGVLLSTPKTLMLPTFRGSSFNLISNPTLPSHDVNTLLVVACSRTSATPATANTNAGWVLFDSYSYSGSSISYYYRIATANNHTIEFTNASGLRQCWAFDKAEIDTINFSDPSDGGNGANLVWSTHPPLTPNSLVGGYIYHVQAQTDIGVVIPTGYTERGKKNSSAAAVAFDSNGMYINTFNPSTKTFNGTSGSWIASAFSVKGRA
jgi:hypothetical protein